MQITTGMCIMIHIRCVFVCGMGENKGKAFIGWRVKAVCVCRCVCVYMPTCMCVLGSSRCFPPAVMNHPVFLLLLLFTPGHRRRWGTETTRRFLLSATAPKRQHFASNPSCYTCSPALTQVFWCLFLKREDTSSLYGLFEDNSKSFISHLKLRFIRFKAKTRANHIILFILLLEIIKEVVILYITH